MTDSSPQPTPGRGEASATQSLDKVEFVGNADPTSQTAHVTSAPVRYRELAAIGLLVVLFDLVVYRGEGYAGVALGFVLAPLLLWAGAPRPGLSGVGAVVFALLTLLAARMVWLGTTAQVLAGLVLIAGFAMTLAGRVPYVLDTLLLGWQTSFAAAGRLGDYARMDHPQVGSLPRGVWLKTVMPFAAVTVFGVVFIQANPDLATAVREGLDAVWRRLEEIFGELLPSATQLCLWGLVVWMSIGLLRPLRFPHVLGWLGPIVDGETRTAPDSDNSPLVPAWRNTLIAVISLFAVYLVFEFQTLWLREFPEGFYYAGYAHEGATWLTVALALATLLLSAIFRGRLLTDQQLPQLRRLAWIWSGLNILLAVAVYHRLLIYIDFNGMTRMRFVGLAGVTTVLAGFLLVVWKIARTRGFLWLIERQLWALALGLYVLAIFPIDAVIHRYNVARILAGETAPVVQITAHDVDASGFAELGPLLEADDAEIRRGIRALLAGELMRREEVGRLNRDVHWTDFQVAEQRLLTELESLRPQLLRDETAAEREAVLEDFRRYAYQWY